MVSSKSQLIGAEPLDTPTKIVLGDGQSLEATHRGEAIIPPNIRLTEVLYVPGLKENLFSVSIASAVNGAKIVMENGFCQIIKNGKIALSAKKRGGVFRVMAASATEPETKKNSFKDYHRRCGHASPRIIRLMSKTGILPPIKERQGQTSKVCQTCLKGKMTRTAIPKLSDTKTQEPGDLIHIDLCGPMRTRSIQGNLYIVSYLDDRTEWIHLGFLGKKTIS
jgi:hypothetical protein